MEVIATHLTVLILRVIAQTLLTRVGDVMWESFEHQSILVFKKTEA